MTTRKRPLPPALRERALAMKKAARAKRIARARALISEVNDRKAEIAGGFWDIGRDLIALRELETHGDLGHRNFHAMCLAEMGLSDSIVSELIDIAEHLTRTQAIAFGTQARAVAFLDLARATPAADTAIELFKTGVVTPKNRVLQPGANAKDAARAAKEFRQAAQKKGAKPGRGLTTTPGEREFADRLARGLARAGFVVEVTAVATKPGRPCTYSVRHLPRTAMPALRKLLPVR